MKRLLAKVGLGGLAQAVGSPRLDWCAIASSNVSPLVRARYLWLVAPKCEAGPLGAHSHCQERQSRISLSPNTFRFNKGLDADDAKVVAYVVSVSTVLSELDVGGNAIGDMGVAAIAQALPFSPTLAVVSLGANALGDAGAVALAQGLRENKVVTTLTLGGNSIGGTKSPNAPNSLDTLAAVILITLIHATQPLQHSTHPNPSIILLP